ncbi:MAG: ABC transporter ATP-binding protein [Chloroflexi bacterium]|nr:ABC transporter ATP-binding protein [Chloroflexota bacterium]MDA1173863.1 ABC transporter ATP-binding protein [Chloroflexota bacterium]
MPALEVRDVSKSFGAAPVVRDVSLTAERGELVCLLGPSGCGKSTLLRLISGLETLDSGAVLFDGKSQEAVAPHMRGFGLMFQDLALFPHMDVQGNVGFGMRMQRRSGDAIRRRVDELLELVGLAGYGRRKVHELSGGERQRVALARSLAPEPKLLMLDEPLGSLDRVLRESLQVQVRSILKEVGVTAICVTHDKDEAFAIADAIVFMDGGLVVQAGTPEALFRAPASELVARSLGMRNILPGKLVQAGGVAQVECAIGMLAVWGAVPVGVGSGGDVLVLIDERGVTVTSARRGAVPAGALAGVIVAREFRGGESELRVRVGNGELICAVAQRDAGADVKVGDDVTVVLPLGAVTLLR